MITLNTQTVITNFNSPMPNIMQGGAFKMEVPQSSFTISRPVSYQFRVAEFVDDVGNIKKVGLQYQVWEHDQYGSPTLRTDWADVNRIQLPFVE